MPLLLGGLTTPSLTSDPIDNPDAGTAFLYSIGTTYKIKFSNGTISTFATGISPEDVQDIVGAFISSANNKLTVTYNDVANTLVLTVVEANIVHQNISGAGTNTHAQIDSHLANTSNPHATTAAQVGADPSGTASSLVASHVADVDPHTQYLLDTTAAITYAIAARNINTGTGLSGGGNLTADRTLSLANTAVTAGTYGASGVPQFTVDAQGRITAASNGPALVIGDNFEQFADLTVFTTTSLSNVAAATFATTSKQVGLYRLGIEWDWTRTATNADSIFGIYVDNVLQDGEFRMETSETATQNIPFGWFIYINFATQATHTIELSVRNEAAATTTVNRVRAEMWRVS